MSLLDALLLDPAPFQFWIAKRTDGIKGSGLAPGDPRDGTTQALFDGAMNLFATQSNVTIHLGPGEFQTNGYADGVSGGWQARPGMKIIGSGMDVTLLKLVNVGSAKHFFAIGHSLATVADSFLVSSLTIDCNITNANSNAACGGVRVMGNHARIERVKVKNWGTKSASVPCFALSLITAYPDSGPAEVVNAGMEGCVVVEPYNNNAALATALNAGSQNDLTFTKEGHAKSPFIRNCFVDCATPGQAFTPSVSSPKYCGISIGWCRSGVAEGNHIYNADIGGPFQDQRSVRDLIVRNNKHRYVDGAAPNDGGATLIEVQGAKNLMVQNNVLDTIATTPLVNCRCGSAAYFNNKTPGGVLLRGWNSDTSRKYDELETEAEDALLLALLNES